MSDYQIRLSKTILFRSDCRKQYFSGEFFFPEFLCDDVIENYRGGGLLAFLISWKRGQTWKTQLWQRFTVTIEVKARKVTEKICLKFCIITVCG